MPIPPIIAVWSQPTFLFPRWKARGINCLLGNEPQSGKVSKSDWEFQAAANGFKFITVPGDDLIAEGKQPNRLAWMQDDEPDNNRWREGGDNSRLVAMGGNKGWTLPSILGARYSACKAAAPAMPVFLNFNGMSITNSAYVSGDLHKPYIQNADWLCLDWHVYRNALRYAVNAVRLQAVGLAKLDVWAGQLRANAQFAGREWPMLACIQVSNQRVTDEGRGPTPDEVELQTQLAAAMGCIGIVYFAHDFKGDWTSGTAWDGCTLEVAQRITEINAVWPRPRQGGTSTGQLDRIEGKIDALLKDAARPLVRG